VAALAEALAALTFEQRQALAALTAALQAPA
jgi:hypothetical protein